MKTPISPKVTAAGLAGVISALLLSVITLITPDLFDGLGKWSGLAYGLTIAVVTAVAGYLKNDPLRVTQPVPTEPPAPAAAAVVVNAPATAAEPAAATTFTATAAKIDALPDMAPVVPAPAEVAPILPN
ncbi:hypothetical protein [Pseudarthrobacter sp. NIBRBAC000502771]|uniref:hypothetical protein n=1 Tax=Pseudarthrobacter sp. NIBRBAC000502771 TaxID=2590774 RepID=UPI0011308C37|nr:hypothetical protein [Pseudarthrobacter sp. NIBRBAC000502771]QDG61252.1 hypothetical protein NIBR502771_02295 [Pseudarthrobacter sp. NIBRBAC000502771]